MSHNRSYEKLYYEFHAIFSIIWIDTHIYII
uniref:Uncharacterized protein n=1 Tax=Rhizophora mucronata TaxID=61149 RepID=A0A2P2PLJ3_RHIMU